MPSDYFHSEIFVAIASREFPRHNASLQVRDPGRYSERSNNNGTTHKLAKSWFYLSYNLGSRTAKQSPVLSIHSASNVERVKP